MSRTGRCAECLMALEPSTKACAHCGTARGVLGKSFKSEPDPNVREQMWNAAISSRIEEPEAKAEKVLSEAEQAWAAVRETAVSAPAFIAKAQTEPEPPPEPDPWSAVVASITQPTREQAGA